MLRTRAAFAGLLLSGSFREAAGAAVNYASGGLDWKAGTNGGVKITGSQCNGTNQSPLNIQDTFGEGSEPLGAKYNPDLRPLNLTYTEQEAYEVAVNDHTIEIKFEASAALTNGIIIPNGVGFVPVRQFHFHAPSEHTLNGAMWPLEMHIVHQNDAKNKTAVIGIFFALSPIQNFSNPFIGALLSQLPSTSMVASTINLNSGVLDASISVQRPFGQGIDLLAEIFNETGRDLYYSYSGSLTTPPCSQGLFWHVMLEPLLISQAQLTAMTTLIAAAQGGIGRGSDNRPVQPQNARTVSKTFTNPHEYICPATDWKSKAEVWRLGIIILGTAFALLFFSNGFCVFLWLRDRDRLRRQREESIVMAQEIAASKEIRAPGKKGSHMDAINKGLHK